MLCLLYDVCYLINDLHSKWHFQEVVVMSLKNQLTELGLTKYEMNAYLCILKNGIVEAGFTHKKANIPYGKIYDTLNSLIAMGLIEVQNTRPKKYKTKKPKLALNNLLSKKRVSMENELGKTEELVTQIIKDIENIKNTEIQEKRFWTTAIGDEIPELILSNFEDAEKEICILMYIDDQNIQNFYHGSSDELSITLSEIMNTLARGVKIRILAPKNVGLAHLPDLDNTAMPGNINMNLEIRSKDEHFPAYFTIIDNDKVIFSVIDPIEQNRLIAMTKVWDQRLASKLKEKFEQMWKFAELVH